MQEGHEMEETSPVEEYYGLNVCVSSDSHVEALRRSVALFGDGAPKVRN